MQKERHQSEINQNFGTVCHAEVCLTFSRLSAKLSGMIAKFRGRSLKIQHRSSIDLNASKTALPCISKIVSNQLICSKDWWELRIVMNTLEFFNTFWILYHNMYYALMNCRKTSQKKTKVLSSEECLARILLKFKLKVQNSRFKIK